MILEGYVAELVAVLDVAGTFAFAASGALAAIRKQLDLFGVLVLSFAASTAGGITRDLLIGATPPAAVTNWLYLAVSALAALLIFFSYRNIRGVVRLRNLLLVVDAMGLALFAVTGTQKSIAFGLGAVMASMLGVLSAIGGGMVRDILVTETPEVLRPGAFYAVAAFVGAALVAFGHFINFDPLAASVGGILAAFLLRMVAVRQRWTLPVAGEEFPDNRESGSQP